MSKTENGSLHRLEDGRWLVVGRRATAITLPWSVTLSHMADGTSAIRLPTSDRVTISGDEHAVIIDPALLDTYVEEKVREERERCAAYVRTLADKASALEKWAIEKGHSGARTYGEVGAQLAFAASGIRALSPSTQGDA
jgi:hypothetical protein